MKFTLIALVATVAAEKTKLDLSVKIPRGAKAQKDE